MLADYRPELQCGRQVTLSQDDKYPIRPTTSAIGYNALVIRQTGHLSYL